MTRYNPDNVKDDFPYGEHPLDSLQVTYEHGQTWLTCLQCGSQWGVHSSFDGFIFEEVCGGDWYCEENALYEEETEE